MNGTRKPEDINQLKDFNKNTSYDSSFDLYNVFSDSEEEIKNFGDMFSDFYYISCPAFEETITQRKDIPKIHEILERYCHTANGRPLEILIGKYSEKTIEKAKKKTENKRKELEGLGIIVQEPKPYMFIVGFFGGTTGRTNEYIIGKIRKIFPDKIHTININS